MENKKQFVVIPPLSEPLKKLNEVLEGVAVDENMEISIIDDLKELSQFVGSAGQCLLAFSNAKKCATFLQDNKIVLAKNHTKVILLTPKEIPAKTLLKFTKIGLTESILENSPPKTLLYKVKLLLRSIKSNIKPEEKERVVKSLLDTNAIINNTEEVAVEKASTTEEESVNYLAEERAKVTIEKDEETLDYLDNLKGKNSLQEEAIETHWRSKQKREGFTLDGEKESATSRIENTDDNTIDNYYRGKKKNNSLNLDPIDVDLYGKKIKPDDVEYNEEEKQKKQTNELDIASASSERTKYVQAEEEGYSLKNDSKKLDLDQFEEDNIEKVQRIEEDPLERKRRELLELDELIEAAKKRQAQAEKDDLGGYYKGKLSKTGEVEELEDNSIDKKEYDNSELELEEKREKLNLMDGEDDSRRGSDEEVDDHEKAKTKAKSDNIVENMSSDKGSTDKIDTYMRSEIDVDSSKNLATNEIDKQDAKKENEEVNDDDDNKRKIDLQNLNAIDLELEKEKSKNDDVSQRDRDNLGLEVENKENQLNRSTLDPAEEEKELNSRKKESNLSPLDEEVDRQKEKLSIEDEEESALRKLKQTDIDLDQNSGNQTHTGKVDKIDTFYRGGDRKKTEHDWDNLNDRGNNINLNLQKAARLEGETLKNNKFKDAGEQTIDYRKLKEEFDAISRGEGSASGDESSIARQNGLNDSDDEGTFKVVEVNSKGFEFGIKVVNLLYQKETKPIDIYKCVADEIAKQHKAYSVFYTYKTSEKKHIEIYDSFSNSSTPLMNDELKAWWHEHKKEENIFNDYFSKSMTTWICREISEKNSSNGFWEDVELPSWAQNELTTKKVELVFPYFDGIDRMGIALLFFPNGINPKDDKAIEVTLEMARSALLESIQRKLTPVINVEKKSEEEIESKDKGGIKNIFSGLFGRNKAS